MKKSASRRSSSASHFAKALVAAGLAIASLSPLGVEARQRTTILSPLAAGYLERARLMMSDANFAGTTDQIEMLLPDSRALSPDQCREVRFMLAKALYERGDRRCVELLQEYVASYPASSRALEARLIIGDYYFFAGDFGKALTAYNAIDLSSLNSADKRLYSYRKGLSMIKTGLYEEAKPIMTQLLSQQAYRPAAEFYLAYIEYALGHYDVAYSGFERAASMLESAPYSGRNFDATGLDAEYYLTQIDFTRGNFREVAERGTRLLNSGRDTDLAPEINRIVGESWFKLGDEQNAYSYLLAYEKSAADEAVASAVYTLGVIDYNRGDFDSAARRFAGLTDLRDPIGQSAYLYLGQCAVKSGDDNAAAMSFENAYKMDFDRNVTETALYNYVAARTRGGNIPFGSSVGMLEDFLSRFPRSQFAPQVEEYLATAYYNEKHYARALQSINRIKNPSGKVLDAKQKVLYELGVEALSNNRPSEAITFMNGVIGLSSRNRSLANQARLWLADAQYADAQYPQAAASYQAFIKSEKKSDNRTLAIYDLAYALYMQGKYTDAISTFSEALKASPALPAQLQADATVRRADCRYYTGDASGALTDYTAALAKGVSDEAYATYRRAVMLGIKGDAGAKIKELDNLQKNYPDSKWNAAAMLEKGLTYSGSGNDAKAAEALKEVVSQWPDAPEARKALLQMALNDAAAGRGQAEKLYREVITRWPASEEASLANEDLRQIYARTGQLGEYQKFLNSIKGAPTLSDSEMERLAYDAAANALSADPNDMQQLDAYVNNYPNGKYLSQALLDLANAAYDTGRKKAALNYVDRLLAARKDAPQVPEALLLKAELLEDEGNAAEALDSYRELERRGGTDFAADAYSGIMRLTRNDNEKIAYARRLRQTGGLTSEQAEEASYYEAEALLRVGATPAATGILLDLCDNPSSLYGSKAVVALGELYLKEKKYAQAEELLQKFTDEGTPHDYELARAYIALADAYHATGRTYLGIEYLKSLKNNYPGKESDILDMIQQRLKTWK